MKKLILALFLLSALFSVSADEIGGIKIMSDAKYRPEKLALKASVYLMDGEYEKAEELYKWLLVFHQDDYFYEKLAEVYLRENKTDDAAALLKKGLLLHPNRAKLHYLMASLYVEPVNDLINAEAHFIKASELEDNVLYDKALAEFYYIKKDFLKAAVAYSKVIKKEPSANQYILRAKSYQQIGDEDKYLADLKNAEKLEDDYTINFMLAEYYAKHSNTEEALKYYEKVVKEIPDNIQLQLKIAEMYKLMNNTEKAVEHFNAMLDKLDGQQKIYILKQIGQIYAQKKEYKKALEYFLMVIKDFPEDVSSYYSAGYIYEILTQFKKAEQVYLKALEIRPDYYSVRKRLAILYIDDKEYKKAEEIYKGILSADRDADYYVVGSYLYRRTKRVDKAIELLEAGYKDNLSNPSIVIELASLYEDKQKHNPKTIEFLKEVLKTLPNNDRVLNFLGYMYAEMNINLEESYEMISKALKQKPDNGAYQDSMGWVLYQMGKYKEAYEIQIKALKKYPKEEEIVEHMKAIMKALGIKKSINEIIKED